LAQAIEILHAIDHSIEILSTTEFKPEPPIHKPPQTAIGIGVVEAPRGTLYHKIELTADGNIKAGEIVVPTGQNQINIETDIKGLVEQLLSNKTKDEIAFEIEKLIRAYDPCMSCGAHFLKVNWH
jgi:coenzyme F420-reducing hydrogenase alpha subunit